jgi:hypothetical protein
MKGKKKVANAVQSSQEMNQYLALATVFFIAVGCFSTDAEE